MARPGVVVGLTLLAAAAGAGLTYLLSRPKVSPPPPSQGSIVISASPASLPDTGGNVLVSGSATNLPAGTTLTLYANGTAVGSQTLPPSGNFTWTWVAPPNSTRTAVVDQLYVQSG